MYKLETIEKAARLTFEDPNLGVLLIVGHPQTGKTHWASQTLARSLDLQSAVISVRTVPPYELAGIPRVVDNPDSDTLDLRYSRPGAIPSRILRDGGLVVLDEVDKAERDNLDTLLSLLSWERRIHETYLPPEKFKFVMLANEGGEGYSEALLGRCISVPWPPKDFSICQTMAFLEEKLPMPPVHLPERPATTSRGCLKRLDCWAARTEFWADDDLRWLVVNGLFDPAIAKIVWNEIHAAHTGTISPELADVISPPQFVQSLFAALNSPQQIRVSYFDRIAARMERDPVFADAMQPIIRCALGSPTPEIQKILAEVGRTDQPAALGRRLAVLIQAALNQQPTEDHQTAQEGESR